MLRSKRAKEKIPERKHPGDPEAENCSPGSIEQQLDMCESTPYRGEEVERHVQNKVSPSEPTSEDPQELVEEFDSFDMTMSEFSREGDELSGDDHSSGLQGEEMEIRDQRNIDTGVPGDGKISNQFDNVIDIFSEREKIRMRKKAVRSKKHG
jgi:hypothetical protein